MKRLMNDDFTEAQLGHQATAINVGATQSIGLLKIVARLLNSSKTNKTGVNLNRIGGTVKI